MYAAWCTVRQPNHTVWVLWCRLWHYLCHLVVLLQSPWPQGLPQILGYHLSCVVQAQVRLMWCSLITCLWLFQNRGHYKACFCFAPASLHTRGNSTLGKCLRLGITYLRSRVLTNSLNPIFFQQSAYQDHGLINVYHNDSSIVLISSCTKCLR